MTLGGGFAIVAPLAIPIEVARGEADQLLVAGNPLRALQLYRCIVEAVPYDCEARVRLADAMALAGFPEAASRTYVAAGMFAARGGHPWPAVLAGRTAAGLGLGSGRAVLRFVAKTYGAGSQTTATRGARLSAPYGISIDEQRVAEVTAQSVADLVDQAARVAGLLEGIRFPAQLPAIPLLSLFPADAIEQLLDRVGIRRLGDAATVFEQGAPSESLCVCAMGRLVAFRGEIEFSRLGAGAIFGETGLLTGRPRGASVRSDGPADVLEIRRDLLAELGQEVPRVTEALHRYRRERLLENLLKTSPLFRPFSPDQRHELLGRFEGIEAAQGEVLLRQGQDGRGLFVILDGECEVTRATDGIEVPVAHLVAGDVFGEISLLHELPAIATVTVSQRATLLCLSALYFHRLVRRVPELGAYFAKLAQERLRHTGNLLGDEVLLQVADGLLL